MTKAPKPSTTPISDLVRRLLSLDTPNAQVVAQARALETELHDTVAKDLARVAAHRAWDADRQRRRRAASTGRKTPSRPVDAARPVDASDRPVDEAANVLKPNQINPASSGRPEGGYISSLPTSQILNLVSEEQNLVGSARPLDAEPTLMELPEQDRAGWPTDYREQFWTLVPPGRRVEKKSAMSKLDAVRKSGRVPWDKFIAGVKRWSEFSRGVETKFIKHPTTWLSKGCWEDELATGARHGARDHNSRTDSNSRPTQTHGDAVVAGVANYAARRFAGGTTRDPGGIQGYSNGAAGSHHGPAPAGGATRPQLRIGHDPNTSK